MFLRARVGVSGVVASESVRQDVGGIFAPKESVGGDAGTGGGAGAGAGAGSGSVVVVVIFMSNSAGMAAVDAFLWDDDDVDDMVEEGKLKR